MLNQNGAPTSEELINNSARLIRMRWLAGLAMLIATPMCVYALRVPLPDVALYALGATILAYNALMRRLSRRTDEPWPHVIATAQIVFDWLALAVFVHLTGGIESPAIAFFLFHVLWASIQI